MRSDYGSFLFRAITIKVITFLFSAEVQYPQKSYIIALTRHFSMDTCTDYLKYLCSTIFTYLYQRVPCILLYLFIMLLMAHIPYTSLDAHPAFHDTPNPVSVTHSPIVTHKSGPHSIPPGPLLGTLWPLVKGTVSWYWFCRFFILILSIYFIFFQNVCYCKLKNAIGGRLTS
jgi:hypothetical protein